MTSPLGTSRRAGLLAPCFQTSGLQDAERRVWMFSAPVCCALSWIPGDGHGGHPCPADRGSDLWSAPTLHQGAPHGPTLPPAPSPLLIPCLVLCQMNSQGLKATGNKGPGGPLGPPSCPGAAAQPGHPAGEQDAGPGVAETRGLFPGLLQTA